MSLTVGDKVADHENNKDDNKDNDVYNTDLNFKLAFIPGANDDLLVQITYTDLDGNPVNVVKRLAGTNAEGQTYEDIKPEADGSYVLKGLKLSENEDFKFDLRLEGTQCLEKGVYVYTAIEGRTTSQSFVGIAEGHRNVDVSASMNISFSVDEEDAYHAEAYWSWENDPVYPPEEPTETPENPTPTPENPTPTPKDPTPSEEITEIPEEETPLDTPNEELEEIPEDIPMAEVPKTGDESGMWTVMMILAAISLLGLAMTGRKSIRA
jgi:LPXTG-motif cell wall-anchored protein